MILLMNVDNENPSEIEGTNTQIEGAGILDFELKGNTEQDSYTGKNLYKWSNVTYSSDVTTTSWCFQGGTVGAYGGNITDKSNSYSFELEAGTYKMSAHSVDDNILTIQATTNGSPNEIILTSTNITPSTSTATITLTEKTTLCVRYRVTNPSLGIGNTKIQIEQGSTATSYEPYCGGIPSPNPDYPQDVKVVTGDNTINVHGKNLFDGELELGTYSGGTGTKQTANDNYRNKNIIKVKPNTTYTFSINGVSQKYVLFYYTSTQSFINSTAGVTTGTFTTPNDCYYINFRCFSSDFTSDFANLKVQLEENSQATEYQPYQSQTYPINLGSIELCKIGDYQDYIYKENNKWYKHSEIGKVVLDGSGNWGLSQTQTNTLRFSNTTILQNGLATSNNKIICNMFTTSGTNDNGDYEHIRSAIREFPTYLFVLINKTRLATQDVAGFKSWLSTHNTTVYYALENPTNTEITDTDLIEQLEAISNSALFDGVNYIDLNSDNLIGSYKITYSTWYQFEKILRSGYNINEDNDRITQKFANGHRKQFVSDYKDCIITLNLDTIDIDTTKEYLRQLKSGPYKYYSLENKEYKTAQFIIEKRPELQVNNSIGNNTEIDEYQVTLLRAGD